MSLGPLCVTSRNIYKGPMGKDKRGGGKIECGRREVGGAGEGNGGKMGPTVIEQQYKNFF